MSLISYGFLLVFLPLSLLIYWSICRTPRAKLWFLCFISYAFYALAGLQFIFVLLILSAVTFWCARQRWITWGVLANLGTLVLFKYWNFGIENINTIFLALNAPSPLPVFELLLPLGISFYVFKHIGYLLDIRKNRYPATNDFMLFTTYSAFFPQIVAGPISSFEDTGTQLRQLPERISSDQIYTGLQHISMGLAKKLLIADQLSIMLESGLFIQNELQTGAIWAWASVFIFALQIYFDFSGYTDIVLGIGALFGVTLPPNFDNPYLATTPNQFWRRWHISLSSWFQVYLFSPLSRNLLRRWKQDYAALAQYTANLITMTLVGLWHGAGWGFIVWGIYHGLLLNLYAWLRRHYPKEKVSATPGVFFIAVLIGWAFFLSPTADFALNLFRNMFVLNGLGSLASVWSMYGFKTFIIAGVASLIVLSRMTEAANMPPIRSRAYMIALGVIAYLAILNIDHVIDFVYVNF